MLGTNDCKKEKRAMQTRGKERERKQKKTLNAGAIYERPLNIYDEQLRIETRVQY